MSIIVLKKFGTNLNTRPLADNIFSGVIGDPVVIDFKGIESASPSFCHEMLVVFREKKIPIRIINTKDNIQLQIKKAVASL